MQRNTHYPLSYSSRLHQNARQKIYSAFLAWCSLCCNSSRRLRELCSELFLRAGVTPHFLISRQIYLYKEKKKCLSFHTNRLWNCTHLLGRPSKFPKCVILPTAPEKMTLTKVGAKPSKTLATTTDRVNKGRKGRLIERTSMQCYLHYCALPYCIVYL